MDSHPRDKRKAAFRRGFGANPAVWHHARKRHTAPRGDVAMTTEASSWPIFFLSPTFYWKERGVGMDFSPNWHHRWHHIRGKN
jgi:hypothetical protein